MIDITVVRHRGDSTTFIDCPTVIDNIADALNAIANQRPGRLVFDTSARGEQISIDYRDISRIVIDFRP